MGFISGVKQCPKCGESMRLNFNTCPRCGYFHGKELDIHAIIQEYKRKTKKEKMENERPYLGYAHLRKWKKNPVWFRMGEVFQPYGGQRPDNVFIHRA